MAGLLAAETRSAAQQFIENIFVADVGACQFDSGSAKCDFEADVCHDSRDDGVVVQAAVGAKVIREDPQGSVAIYIAALFVYEQGAIGVAVKSDSQIGFFFDDC